MQRQQFVWQKDATGLLVESTPHSRGSRGQPRACLPPPDVISRSHNSRNTDSDGPKAQLRRAHAGYCSCSLRGLASEAPEGGRYKTEPESSLGEKNLRLSFDDEEGVGIRAT